MSDSPSHAPPEKKPSDRAREPAKRSFGDSLRSPRSALPYRHELETRFGVGLGGVRAHLGEQRLMSELGARGAAHGNTVAFATTSPSRETVAHEVAHTLQAQVADGVGDPEHEAAAIARRVDAGMPAPPVQAQATGVLRDAASYMERYDLYSYLAAFDNDDNANLIAFDLAVEDIITNAPYGTYIIETFNAGAILIRELRPFNVKLAAAIAPESYQDLVDRARWHDKIADKNGDLVDADYGPMEPSEGVRSAIVNAIGRALYHSMARMIPRYLGAEAGNKSPDPASLLASHPMDVAVATMLCSADDIGFFPDKLRREHPEVVAEGPCPATSVDLQFLGPSRQLWHWVEAPADARAEDVAYSLFGDPTQAYRLIANPPLWGFRGPDIPAFLPARRQELDGLAVAYHRAIVLDQADIDRWNNLYNRQDDDFDAQVDEGPPTDAGTVPEEPTPQIGFPLDDVDPILELQVDPEAAKQAREQAKAAAEPTIAANEAPRDETAIYDRVGENLMLLDRIERSAASLDLSADVVGAQIANQTALRDEVMNSSVVDPEGTFAVVDAQNRILGDIATGLVAICGSVMSFGALVMVGETPVAVLDKVPEELREPFVEAGKAYEAALVALDTPIVARARTDHASELQRTLTATALQAKLQASQEKLEDADYDLDLVEPSPYDPMKLEVTGMGMMGSLSKLQMLLMADNPKAYKDLEDIRPSIEDYATEADLIDAMHKLDATWRAIDSLHGFWEWQSDEYEGVALQIVNRDYYKRFKDTIFTPFVSGNAEQKKQARENFADLIADEKLRAHFDAVRDHLESDAKHQAWSKMIAAVAIAIVAFGLGQAVGAAFFLEQAGVGFALAAGGTETVANIVLNKAVLDQDPTLIGTALGFVGSAGMYGVMGKLAAAGKVAGATQEIGEGLVEASKLAKFGAGALKFGKGALYAQAIGTGFAELDSLLEHGRLLSADELPTVLASNLVMHIGFEIATPRIEAMIESYRNEVWRERGVDFEWLAQERAAIKKIATELKTQVDPEKARLLLHRERAYVEREQAAMERLAELAREHPEWFPKGEAERIAGAIDRGDLARQINQSEAMLGTEEIGPNMYRADPRSVDAIMHAQKAEGGQIASVVTDPVTGLRTITIRTRVGESMVVKEKLLGKNRPAMPVSPAEARRFEDWLDQHRFHDDDATSELFRARLREYYARDPAAAIELGTRYGFGPEEAIAPRSAKTASEAAYEHYTFERSLDPTSRPGEEPMTRADFDTLYRQGLEYDPVSDTWVRQKAARPATHSGGIPKSGVGGPTHFVGEVPSPAIGAELMKELASGNADALRMVGVEPPPGFDPRANEWGLGQLKDGRIVLVRGGAGEVDWSALPSDLKPLAHTHPFRDPTTGTERLLTGANPAASGSPSYVIDVKELWTSAATHRDRVYLMPSTSDLAHVAASGTSHTVQTPYVHLGEGRIGNPAPGLAADPVQIVIVSAKPVGAVGNLIVYEGQYQMVAGGEVLATDSYTNMFMPGVGDIPSQYPPPFMGDLPPGFDPGAPTSTPAGDANIGNVDAATIAKLRKLGMPDPMVDPDVLGVIEDLSPQEAKELANPQRGAPDTWEGRVDLAKRRAAYEAKREQRRAQQALIPNTPEHKAERWIDYQHLHPDRYPKITEAIDPAWSRKYDQIFKNKHAGGAFEEGALADLGFTKNIAVMIPDGHTSGGFIPDSVKGNPPVLEWGKPYDFVEVKGWADMSNTGNLKAMLDYVESDAGAGSTITVVFRSAKEPPATSVSRPLEERLNRLRAAGRATIIRYP